jgi:uncharacterized repeat protein (TIGR01451 family)
VEYVDPTGSSLLPVWGTWNVPGAVNGAPGVLRITFQVRILPGVQPGIYDMTTAVTASADVPVQVLGGQAPLAVGKGTSVPISMQVGATSLYAARGGPVMYVITVENDSIDAAQSVTVTDSLPSDLTFANTNSITINGAPVGSNLVPAPGSATPQWGPFTIPAGGFSGSTLVITFTARVSGSAGLGPHPNVVSGSSSNAQITGGSDATPVTITAG